MFSISISTLLLSTKSANGMAFLKSDETMKISNLNKIRDGRWHLKHCHWQSWYSHEFCNFFPKPLHQAEHDFLKSHHPKAHYGKPNCFYPARTFYPAPRKEESGRLR